jgi:hypothetical protein
VCTTCRRTDPGTLRPIADDHEATARLARETFDNNLCTLVRDKTTGQQVEVVLVGLGREALYIDRRMDHRRFASIGLPDTPSDVARICDKMIDMMSAGNIPLAQPCEQPTSVESPQSALHAGMA